jgi:hypothetical protein
VSRYTLLWTRGGAKRYLRFFWVAWGFQTERTPLVSSAWLRTLDDDPALVGRGLAFRVGKIRTLRAGLCREMKIAPEEDGQVRTWWSTVLETSPEEIGTWDSEEGGSSWESGTSEKTTPQSS